MTEDKIKKMLKGVTHGTVTIEEAIEQLKELPFQDLIHTKIDHHRKLRKGMEEVLFGQGKSLDHMTETIRSMRKKGSDILVTRIGRDVGLKLKKLFPEGEYAEPGKCFVIKKDHAVKGKGMILIISAGTSDIPVAEEAYATCKFFGNETEKLYDVGVAGIHRLFQSYAAPAQGPGDHSGRGHGGGASIDRGGCRRRAGDRYPYERWLRGELWRRISPSYHA